MTLATRGRERLWAGAAGRVRSLRAVASIGGSALVLFCLVDDHGHLVLDGDRCRVGALARRLNRALGTSASGPMAPADIRPVRDRAHLYHLVEYVLRQPVRHGLRVHPACWPGSCFFDLVGLRFLPGFSRSALGNALPRLREDRIWSAVEASRTWERAPEPEGVHELGVARVLEAASDALAVDPASHGTLGSVARAMTVRICRDAGLRTARIAEEMALTRRAVRRLALRPLGPEQERVARMVGLRAAINGHVVDPNESERRSLARSRVLIGGLPEDRVQGFP